MQQTVRHGFRHRRLFGLVIAALLVPLASVAGAGPAAQAAPTAQLNRYCGDHGAVGRLSNGRTVYCVQVQRTDAFVWSYSSDPIPMDPNSRGYNCNSQTCRWPDGSTVPNYQRCGLLCGEPPTNSDIQSGLNDCFQTGADFEDCESRIR
ncbi:hypothetical protein [Nocardia sp. NBC_00511]|uniref:hypothetical protein n=1 Tax=Nocardia sp. NBC_00511 TaxID=2903591 RepID=UPI0030E4CE5B